MSAPDASSNNSYVEICPVGRWVHINEAVKQITKNGNVQSLRERHKIDLSFAIEKCSSKLRFFTNVEFVYICRERTGEALSSMTLTLPKFVKLTNYLSDESSWASPESSMADLFQQYTGLEASKANIDRAFSEGALISKQFVQDLFMKREEEKARAAKTKCKGITAKRIKDVKNMEYARDRLNMQKDIKGDFRTLNCTGKATDKCPRCTKCNSIYRNLSKHWDELMKPEVCAPAEIK